jgi:predicted site-specific integrase-resolvase
MRAAVYARVSATRQAQAQTIEQQLDRLRAAVAERGWELEDQHVYRDDGYSGARLGRPGLDRLRDHAVLADLDVVLVVAPDRQARNYVHQVLLIEELAGHGCRVEFLDRPMSDDPHDQLLLQIRGAVAEYERMRRGRHARLRAGTMLPWTRPPFGYRLDPTGRATRPRSGQSPGRGRRCWSRSCSTGTCSRRPPCISSPCGWPAWGWRPRRASRAGPWPACAASCATRPTQAAH